MENSLPVGRVLRGSVWVATSMRRGEDAVLQRALLGEASKAGGVRNV